MLQRLLEYKPGAAFYIIGGLLLFFAMAVFAQYRMKGRVDLRAMFDRTSEFKPFFDQNPHLEFVDYYPHTAFVVVRDRATGTTAMLDLAELMTAQVHATTCEEGRSFSPNLIYSGATQSACFVIDKPDTGTGFLYTFGVSFSANAKQSQVEQFYRALFTKQGKKISVITDSSEGLVLEAENEDEDTVARVSIRSSFDTVQGFLSWTKDFH